MSMDDQDVRTAVRRTLERIGDAAAPARRFDEIGVPSTDQDGDHSTQPRRLLAIAGSLAVLGALVVGLLVVRADPDDTSPSDGPATDSISTTPGTAPVESSLTPVPPSSVPSEQPTQTTATPTTATPTTAAPDSAAPESDRMLEEIRRTQVEALRNLPGFTATATRTVFTPSTGAPESEQTAQVTLLADGSFFADQGELGWGSFDPTTHIVRGVFALPDGTTGYQEIVGQATNSVPLNILTGHDPTALVQPGNPDTTSVRDTTFEGRPVWEVTTVFDFDPSMCEGGCEAQPATQTTVQTVDQETGLMIRQSITSTAPNTVPSLSVLRDVRVVERMPAEFPGSFPPDVTVDRSGDPNAVATIAVGDIAVRFGIAVPLPAGLETATISYQEMNGSWIEPDGAQIATLHRSVEFSVPEGFTTTRVTISASAVTPGGAVPPGMIVVDGGYLCGSADGDDECDTVDGATISSRQTDGPVMLTSGALAGLPAYPGEGSASATSGPFQISVIAGDRASALAIANDFVLVQP